MDTVFVKPKPGGRVRQPDRMNRVLPDEGDHVVRDAFYERLIISGDVVVSDPPAPPKTNATAAGKRAAVKED
jgi:hypothetical protein